MTTHTRTIGEVLGRHPIAGLAPQPTPIQELRRLSSDVGRRVFVLCEDLTAFGLGGNKVRKLEYLVGDALAKGADVLVTSAASSFSRNAAAAGRVCGLDVHVVVGGTESEHNPASRAVFDRYGATVHHVTAGGSAVAAEVEQLVGRLKAQGRSVYELHPGGSDEIGALGYLHVFGHIVEHSAATGTHFDAIVLASGSTGTHVGLLLGQCLSGYATRVIGMAISQPEDVQRERTRVLAASAAEAHGIPLDASTLIVDDRFLGEGYAVPSAEGERAVRTFAEREGLLLDSVYSGKAAAGLLHCAREGAFGAEENVLFLHTGGNAGLYY